jgi:lysyl-tRNA synthetase class 1
MKKKNYQFWLDTAAQNVIEREKKLKRGIKIFRVESGLGASGFPHIGSFGDAVRNYAVSLALKDSGVKSEFIAYSDNRDGLRKVPLSLPESLEKYIGAPVTDIPDPFGKCHNSFGEHMSSLLLDALNKAGIEYKNHSATEDYKNGVFNKQIETILLNAEKAGKIVKKITGSEKFIESLPYLPVCGNCGKIYTTRSYQLLPKEHKVLYVCDQEFTGKNVNTGKEILVKGCGHKGEASYFNGSGKLSWKVEFAMRWSALQIVFEAHGKDILDSVKVNDEIAGQILNFEPPLHVVYEMFLDKGGKKIAKSYGNVFTPQVWLDYGNTQSLILLMLKRFEGTRELDVTDISRYMDELHKLERIYFDLEKADTEKDLINLKRLFEYVYFLKQPKKPSVYIPYEMMVEIAKVLPEKNQLEFALEKLKESGHVEKLTEIDKEKIKAQLEFAINWVKEFEKPEVTEVTISGTEKNAIKKLIEVIEEEKDGERLQTRIFQIAKDFNIQPVKFFKTIYQILLKSERGPRLGPYIIEIEKKEVIEKLKKVI